MSKNVKNSPPFVYVGMEGGSGKILFF